MKVKIHNSTYIFLLLSFLSGYFEYIFLFLITIAIHELGHAIFASIINFKYSNIIIYPFGGITIYDEDLNTKTNIELFVLIGGIIFQLLFFILIYFLFNNGLITEHVYLIIKKINYLLISFNFMPIIPLDGGKLLNIILDKVFNYRLSSIISIIISIFSILFFIIYKRTYFSILLTIFLIKCIYIEIINLKYRFNRFILERYINNYSFKKIKIINNINKLKRDYYHIINNEFERSFINRLFNK